MPQYAQISGALRIWVVLFLLDLQDWAMTAYLSLKKN